MDRSAYLQAILESLPDALIVIDQQGLIKSFSPAAEEMFGWSAPEVIDKNVKLLMPPPYREQHDAYMDNYKETGERRIIGIGRVVVGERKDGTTFPIELAVAETRIEGQRYFTGVIRDLTVRQMTEARLQELQAEMVHIARVSSMGNMASALAHELNQPLSAIANYLKGSKRLIAQGQYDPDRLVDAIDKAADQALRAGDIIRRLREFIAHGTTERRAEPLVKLIEEASALAMVGAGEGGSVRLRLDFDPAVDTVLADRVEIQQVLVNLLRNALEAMRESPRRELVIATRRRDATMVVVSVTDTGPGIAPDIAENLFKPFRTTKSFGMGVGLSISRSIIEAHGGEIWAEAAPGGGAAFKLTLPTNEGPAP